MSFDYLENKEDITLLKTVANSLFSANCTLEDDVDWSAVLSESKKQAVCSVCFDGIGKNATIPEDISNNWFGYIGSYMQKNIIVNQNHGYVDSIMKQNDIPYCILKGAASEYYYPNPSLRAMGDVDFIVPKEYFDKAIEVLLNDGFEMDEIDYTCHRVFNKGKINLEMHFEPAGMPEGEKGKIAEEFLADIFEKNSYVSLLGVKFENPSPLHHGLVMLFHTYHHMLSEGIGLRHLCDWAVFVNSLSNDEFIEIFEEKLKKIGLWRFAQILSATSCEFLKMPYKEWIGEIDKNLAGELIEDILSGGNFGNKDKTRAQQGNLISNKGKDGVKTNKFFTFIQVKNNESVHVFPIIEKFPFMKHIGFIFMVSRYTFNVLKGKRKALSLRNVTTKADKRIKIYSQFKLFEKEE